MINERNRSKNRLKRDPGKDEQEDAADDFKHVNNPLPKPAGKHNT
jgi:hypothetical protein